jgi:hypothetical protein
MYFEPNKPNGNAYPMRQTQAAALSKDAMHLLELIYAERERALIFS